MSWRITPSNALVDDQDALTYLAAVEAADGQALESGVRLAVNAFVKGCKADGIWPAIKASCILAGARTLQGALVPLVGTAPTNVNFVAGDYNRETGLVGDGSTKRLDANRAGNADPQNNRHIAAYISETSAKTDFSILVCDALNGVDVVTQIGVIPGTGQVTTRASNNAGDGTNLYSGAGFYGVSRSISANYAVRGSATSQVVTRNSQTPLADSYGVFMRTKNAAASPGQFYDGRLAFYSIGESLNLALLDARVTTLINAIAAAIP